MKTKYRGLSYSTSSLCINGKLSMLDIIIETASTFGEVIAVAVTGFSAWVGYKQLQKRPEQKSTTEHIPLHHNLNSNETKCLSSLIVFEPIKLS